MEKNITALNEKLPGKAQDVFDTRSIVNKLENYMDRVTQDECNAQNVHAAVSCADKIIDILRLHLDVERLKIKTNPTKKS